jgi:prepilin-type N-terminal cleavage/methylation domain-containing protein
MSNRWNGRAPRAFTLIEVLVAIGIIGVLIAILMPALAAARGASRKAEELANVRQLWAGWSLYASESDGRVLPGYLADDVQEKWKLKFTLDIDGSVVPKEFTRSYPFRLLPYLSHQHVLLREYVDSFEPDPRKDLDGIASHPAFGYNAIYVGGWYEGIEDSGRPIVRFEASNTIARSITAIDRSSEVVVFASSAERKSGASFDETDTTAPGAHYVVPPTVAQSPQWTAAGSAVTVLSDTAVPAMRHTSQVACVFADGHTGAEAAGGLFDQRRWIAAANARDFTHVP